MYLAERSLKLSLPVYRFNGSGPLAFMGGIYGNIPALEACIADAQDNMSRSFIFLGDMIGCCGHSNEVIDLVKKHFNVVIAGNHEQKAAAGSQVCGCGYSSPNDEKYGCLAYQYAMNGLSDENRKWMKTLPDMAIIEAGSKKILLCHGSPEQTNEFLYESQLDDTRLENWLSEYDVIGIGCSHTGLPWVRQLTRSRFAFNCGVVGKSDHDGDPAVHYVLLWPHEDSYLVEIRRVEYDYTKWAHQLEEEGVDHIFVSPIKTGLWTTGVASMPELERTKSLSASFQAKDSEKYES